MPESALYWYWWDDDGAAPPFHPTVPDYLLRWSGAPIMWGTAADSDLSWGGP